jgi:hypothetical protein
MKAVHFDAKTGHEIAAHEVQYGIVGFISWRRLSEIFRASKEIQPTEELLSFQIDDRGITFRVSQ